MEKVLVPVPAVHTHVKALDEPVLDGICDPLVKICIDVCGVEVRSLQKGDDILQFVHCPSELVISGANQGYHQINWDNPGYPGLVTCGPERVGTGATPKG